MNNTLSRLKEHLTIVKQLHARLSMCLIQPSTVDHDSIYSAIAHWTTDEAAAVVSRCLEAHFKTTGSQVNAFRASVVFWFGTDEIFWPVIEWTEECGFEGLALFYLDQSAPDVCSYMMHRAQKGESDKNIWSRESISWLIFDIYHLKSLFHAAKHLLGILNWDPRDVVKFYGQAKDNGLCDEEE